MRAGRKSLGLFLFFWFFLHAAAAEAFRFCDPKEMAELDVDGPKSGLQGDLGPYLQNVGSRSTLIEWNYAKAKSTDFQFSQGPKKIVLSMLPTTHPVVGVCELKPEESYLYAIDQGEPHRFQTLPESDHSSFRFAVVGDSGTRNAAQKAVFEQIAAFKPLFIVMTGDLAYPNGRYVDYQENFLKPLQDLLSVVPVFPCLGNHDKAGKAYLDIFSLPHNNDEHSERYYSFDAGPVHFAVLDSSQTEPLEEAKSTQLKWLDSDLGGTKQPWKIVVFHHPPYASGIFHAEDLGIRWAVEPLLVKHGVDLVLNGHHHSYQRSYPQKGVVYIVTGGGGGKLRSIYYQKAYTEKAVVRRYHFVGMEVSKDKISLTTIDLNGAVIDTWEKSK